MPTQLAGILAALDQAFGLAESGEFTLEANPGTVDAAGLELCRRAGYNRISFGLQAVQPHLLKLLGRIHDWNDFTASVNMAVRAGFLSINADIMIGLPRQTINDVAQTLDSLLQLPVDHISFYSLSLEDGTPLQKICARDPGLLPDEETERAQYHLVRQTLLQAGFEHYEISNAARPGHRCRHNQVYWHGGPYYGFGVAAHSFTGQIRRGNTSDLAAYLAAWNDQDPANPPQAFAAARVLETIGRNEAQKEMMLLGLRLLDGVDFTDFAARFGCDLRDCFGGQLRELTRRGLLQADNRGVRLTLTGLDLANQVFMEFV